MAAVVCVAVAVGTATAVVKVAVGGGIVFVAPTVLVRVAVVEGTLTVRVGVAGASVLPYLINSRRSRAAREPRKGDILRFRRQDLEMPAASPAALTPGEAAGMGQAG